MIIVIYYSIIHIYIYIEFVRVSYSFHAFSRPRGQLERVFCNRLLSLSLSLSHVIKKYKKKNTKIRRDGPTEDLSRSILVNSVLKSIFNILTRVYITLFLVVTQRK